MGLCADDVVSRKRVCTISFDVSRGTRFVNRESIPFIPTSPVAEKRVSHELSLSTGLKS